MQRFAWPGHLARHLGLRVGRKADTIALSRLERAGLAVVARRTSVFEGH